MQSEQPSVKILKYIFALCVKEGLEARGWSAEVRGAQEMENPRPGAMRKVLGPPGVHLEFFPGQGEQSLYFALRKEVTLKG